MTYFEFIFIWAITGFFSALIQSYLFYRKYNSLLIKDFLFYLFFGIALGTGSFIVAIGFLIWFLLNKHFIQNTNFLEWLNKPLIGGNDIESKSKD